MVYSSKLKKRAAYDNIKESVENISDFFDSTSHMFTLIGVFGAISVYLVRFGPSDDDYILKVGTVSGFIIVVVLSALVFFQLYDVLIRPSDTLSIETGFSILFTFFLSTLLLSIIGTTIKFENAVYSLIIGLGYTILFISSVIIYNLSDNIEKMVENYWAEIGVICTILSVLGGITIIFIGTQVNALLINPFEYNTRFYRQIIGSLQHIILTITILSALTSFFILVGGLLRLILTLAIMTYNYLKELA